MRCRPRVVLVVIAILAVATTFVGVRVFVRRRRAEGYVNSLPDVLNPSGQSLDCKTMHENVLRSAPDCGIVLPRVSTERFCVDAECWDETDVEYVSRIAEEFSEKQRSLRDKLDELNQVALTRIGSFSDAQKEAFEQLNVDMRDRYEVLKNSREDAISQLETVIRDRYSGIQEDNEQRMREFMSAMDDRQDDAAEQRQQALEQMVSGLDDRFGDDAERTRQKFAELNTELTKLKEETATDERERRRHEEAERQRRTFETSRHGGDGGSPHTLLCPGGSFVTDVFGRSGEYIDQIGIGCSDGTIVYPKGGDGGSGFDINSSNGFRKADLRTGSLVDNIRMFGPDGSSSKGQAGGSGGSRKTIDCQSGGKFKGFNVRTGSLVDSIQGICGTMQPQN